METPWDKLIRNVNPGWLTKHDSRMQVSRRRNSPNRLKILSESGFFDTALLMFCFKYLPQPTREIHAKSGLGDPCLNPNDGDAMINDAGKYTVKSRD